MSTHTHAREHTRKNNIANEYTKKVIFFPIVRFGCTIINTKKATTITTATTAAAAPELRIYCSIVDRIHVAYVDRIYSTGIALNSYQYKCMSHVSLYKPFHTRQQRLILFRSRDRPIHIRIRPLFPLPLLFSLIRSLIKCERLQIYLNDLNNARLAHSSSYSSIFMMATATKASQIVNTQSSIRFISFYIFFFVDFCLRFMQSSSHASLTILFGTVTLFLCVSHSPSFLLLSAYVRLHARVYVSVMCVCVCVCARGRKRVSLALFWFLVV